MHCISNALIWKYMNVISSQILQFVSQPAFLTILTQNHLCGKKKNTPHLLSHRPMTAHWLRSKSHIFYFKISTDARARGSKFSAQCYDKVVCPSYMHTTWNSMYFVRAAAVRSYSKKVCDLERTSDVFKEKIAPHVSCLWQSFYKQLYCLYLV